MELGIVLSITHIVPCNHCKQCCESGICDHVLGDEEARNREVKYFVQSHAAGFETSPCGTQA